MTIPEDDINLQSIPREVLSIIGDIWGRLYGKIQSKEAMTLKRVQEEYDQDVFTVDAQSITSRIGKTREKIIIQEYGDEGMKYFWDVKVLLFAKEMGVKLKSKDIFFICRDVLEEAYPPEYEEERKRLLKNMEPTVSVVSESENLGIQQEIFASTIPPIEFVRFFRELLDMGKKEDAALTMQYILDPEQADLLLRRRYVDRLPFVDANGNKIPVPDQPIVGRFNEKKELTTIIGNPPLYQARILHLFAIAAYYDISQMSGLSEEAKVWLKEQMDHRRFLKENSQQEIEQNINIAIDLNLIRRYWDNLLSDIRNSFYGLRNYTGLASKTQHLLRELEKTPNVVFTPQQLKKRIIESIKAGVQFYFVQNYKMAQEDVINLINDKENQETYLELIEKYWISELPENADSAKYGSLESLYREVWNFWSSVRAKYIEQRKEELTQDFMFLQEQKKVIDSLDTLAKKQFSSINSVLRSNPVNTGIEVLDRAIAIFGLELTEVALSNPSFSEKDKEEFRNYFMNLFKEEMEYLLPKLVPGFKQKENPTNMESDKEVISSEGNNMTEENKAENTNN